MRYLLLLILVAPYAANSASLLGDHTCQQWMNMEAPAKKAWTDSFLAPLSLTLKAIKGTKRDQYNEDPLGAGQAVIFIDDYCTRHPEKVAADGAGAYFKTLMGQ